MNYAIVPGGPGQDDRSEWLRLMNRNFGAVSPEWYEWTHLKCPYGDANFWLVQTEEGERVGMTGLMKRRLVIDGKSVSAGQAANININTEHRTAQAAIKLQRALIAKAMDEDISIVFGVTDTAIAVLRRAGYKVVGGGNRWTKPLRSEYRLRDRIRPIVPRKIVCCAVDLGLRLRSPETWSRRINSSHLAKMEEYGAAFDQFWSEIKPISPIGSERTSDFLRWRFTGEPGCHQSAFCLLDDDNKIAAAVIYRSRDDNKTKHGDAVVGVHDLLYRDLESLETVLAEFSRAMRREGRQALMLNYFGKSQVADVLRKSGFFPRPWARQVLAWVNPSQRDFDPTRVLDPENWQLTEADLAF